MMSGIMMIEENKSLSIKQKKFTKALAIHGNGARAAREAGYSENSAKQIAAENLTKPYLNHEVARIQDQLASEVGINARETLLFWKQCMGDKTQLAGALKASEFIAKYLRMFDDDKLGMTSHEQVLKELEKLERNKDDS